MNETIAPSPQKKVLDYGLQMGLNEGYFATTEIRPGHHYPLGELPEGTIALFDDAEMIVEYVTTNINWSDRSQAAALGTFLCILDEHKLLRTGDMRDFNRAQLSILAAMCSPGGQFNSERFESVNEPEKWKQWWISLANSPARHDLTADELVRIGCWTLYYVQPDLFNRLDGAVKGNITASMVKFLLDAVQKGVYPWNYNF